MTPNPSTDALVFDQPLEQAFGTFNELFEHLAGSYQSLEQQVESLKAQLAAQDLQAMLGLAHQLRSPLTTASLSAARIKQCEDPQQRHQLCDRLIESLSGLNAHIEDLLQLARHDDQAFETMTLNDLHKQLVQNCRSLLQQTACQLVWACVESEQCFRGKRHALSGAIQNLIENAMQAAASKVSIQMDINQGQVFVRIIDDGRGCSPEQMQNMFTPYRSTRQGGSGLGLTMARQIARAHMGDLFCESSSDQGSVFVMHWPMSTPNVQCVSTRTSTSKRSNPIRSDV